MSITVMCDEKDADRSFHYGGDKEHLIHTKTYAIGKVVSLRESNGYNDSDFYATYYDEEKDTFVTIEYATTRAWCYPNNASIDASPELMQKFKTWKTEQAKRYREAHYLIYLKDLLDRIGYEIPLDWANKLLNIPNEYRKPCITLLKTRKFRSKFRQSLRNQLGSWLNEEHPKYPLPFSDKQWGYLYINPRDRYYR